jgi:outer membrane receptor protein involved in Fe transport
VNRKISSAVAAVLASQGQNVIAQDNNTSDSGGGLEEIVVSAQRRDENIQDVPITVQALTSETLDELKVTTIDEFVKFLPNVQSASQGPTHGNFSIRGMSLGAAVFQGGGTVGQWPTVGLYLDDQAVQMPGRNLDVYAADLQRIEVLEGPQGTLFGAGAQAGVVRYITNKPKHDVTESYFKAGYGVTSNGADSTNLQAMLNLPLGDKLALRAVAYNDSRGGYIDNIPATFTRRGTDLGFALRTGGVVPADSVAIDNFKIAREDINDVTYKGVRLGLSYNVNDDWNVLLVQSFQDIDSGGVFYSMPFASDCPTPTNAATCTSGGPSNAAIRGRPLGQYQVTLFNDTLTRDEYSNTALTISGKIGQFDFVYSGSKLDRDNFIQGDYTNYARGVWGTYYQCTGYSGASVNKCYTPSSVWTDTIKNKNTQHEVRLSTPADWKVSGIVGLFWEERKVNDDTEWLYKSVPECTIGGPGSCFFALDPLNTSIFAGASFNNTARRNSATGFFNDFKRTYEQQAVFLSLDWHVLDNLTLTAGTRYFESDNVMLGGNVGSFFCKNYQAGLSTFTGICNDTNPGYYGPGVSPYGTNLNRQNPNTFTSEGFRSRFNVSWKLREDVLLYATWSEGFRPGGFNRGTSQQLRSVNRSTPTPTRGATNQYQIPFIFESDDLVNYEIGWKTTFLNNRLQFNGAIYRVEWDDAQAGIFAPQVGFGNLTVSVNGPSFESEGIQLSVIAKLTDALTLEGAAAYTKAELTNSPQFINNIPGTPGFGQPITEAWVGSAASGRPVSVVNVFGVAGDPAAMAPELQANVRARYEWERNDYGYYWQLGAVYMDERRSAANRLQTALLDSYTDLSLSAGVSKGNWTAELVVTNLTDRDEAEFASSSQFIETINPPRPRTIAVQFGYKFGE